MQQSGVNEDKGRVGANQRSMSEDQRRVSGDQRRDSGEAWCGDRECVWESDASVS